MNAPKGKAKKGLSSVIKAQIGGLPGLAYTQCLRMPSLDETVYFIQCGDFVKIGFTRGTAESRLAAFSTASPHDFTILATVPGGQRLEKNLHKLFAEYWHRGEWFRYEGSLLEFIGYLHKVNLPRKDSPRPSDGFEEMDLLGQYA